MDKQLKKIYIFMGIFVGVILIGASYAFFTAGMSSETSTTVRADAGTMKITYDGGANITLDGIYPRDEVWATKNITVTGNNTTDAEMYYKLTLVVDSNTFKTSDPLQYELVSTNTSTNGEVIPAIDKTDLTETSIELGDGHFVKANNARHTYQLKIYYPKKTTSQNDNQGSAFSAHVEITSAKATDFISAPDGWFDAKKGTLMASLRDNNKLSEPLTTPGMDVSAHVLDDVEIETDSVSSTYQSQYFTYGTGWEANGIYFNLTGAAVTSDTYANSYSDLIGKYLSKSIYWAGSNTAGDMQSTTELGYLLYIVDATQDSISYKTITSNKNTTEAVLASTEDDYGTSYYFRGAVKNNYVQFANKCWRIVRIVGDGSVKLILHNNNNSGKSNPCSSANNSDTAAFASRYGSMYNINYNDNAYVGFMYGVTNASDYASAYANTNSSTILSNLEAWYENNLSSYSDKLADTIWCNDKSTINGYTIGDTKYGAYSRLKTSKTPSLICPNDNNGGKLSKFTVSDTTNGNGDLTYKFGLLTADEIAYAGYIDEKSNKSTYLKENTGINWWYSMSPHCSFNRYAYVWSVGGGSLSDLDVSSNTASYRPAISLVSNIEISGGTGTSEDPYVVK